jgi:hypothetical protein
MNKSDLDSAPEAEEFGVGPTTPSGLVISPALASDEVLMPDEAL